MALSLQRWFGLGTLVFLELILLPLILFIMHRFYKYRKTELVFHRHYELILGTQIWCSIIIAIERPLFYSLYVCDLIPITYEYEILWSTIWSLCLTSIAFLFLLRTWIVSFHTRLARSTEKQQWKNIISARDSSWILDNLHTWGNIHWCAIRLSIPYILTNISYITLVILKLSDVMGQSMAVSPGNISLLLFTIICTIAFCFIQYRTPTYNDALGIKPEMRCIIWLTVCVVVEYAIGRIIGNTISYYIFHIEAIGVVLLAVLMVVIPAYWTLRHVEYFVHIHQPLQKINNDCNMQIPPESPADTPSTVLEDGERTNSFISTVFNSASTLFSSSNMMHNSPMAFSRDKFFRSVLQNCEGFEAFVLHLQREFSVENIVAYIEFHQIVHFIIPYVSQDKRLQFLARHDFELPYNIPISSILRNTRFNIKMKTSLLHSKYIRRYAIFELNLSSALRKTWLTFAQSHLKLDIDDLKSNHIRTRSGSIKHLWRIPDNVAREIALNKAMSANADEKENVETENKDIIEDLLSGDKILNITTTVVTLSAVPDLKFNQYSCETVSKIGKFAMKVSRKNPSTSLNANYSFAIVDGTKKMDEEFAVKLLSIICKVMDECYTLMKDSFTRYDDQKITKLRQLQFVQTTATKK